jgi:hypothetical protein
MPDIDDITFANHFSEPAWLKKGLNEMTLESMDAGQGKKTGIDFIWMKGN